MSTAVKPKHVMSGNNVTMINGGAGGHKLDQEDELDVQAGSSNLLNHDAASPITTPTGRRTTLTEHHEMDLKEYYSKKLVVPPSKSVGNPANVYPQTPGFENGVDVYEAFRLQHSNGTAITPAEREKALKLAKEYFTKIKATYMGYQVNQDQDFADSLGEYVNMHINNAGDPFSEGTNRSHSKFMERAVLDYFASLWRARWPHDQGEPNNQNKLPDRKSYWGYCLSMGATEGNMYGMWNGRDYLGGKVMLSDKIKPLYVKASVEPSNIYELDEAEAALRATRSFTPICFFSKDTHYSLKKCMTILNIRTFYEEGRLLYPHLCPTLPNRTKKTWPHTVPSKEDGSVDIDSLAILVEFFVKLGYPILVNFNYGTTFKGAYDDVEAAGERLIPILEKYGMYERIIRFKHRGHRTTITRNGFWFHVDGALGAAYMPFIEAAHASKLLDAHGAPIMPNRGPNFDFRLPFVHSISMSGHKWIGAPVPCGIYMSKTMYELRPPDIPMIIGCADTTFAGSRSGLAVMFMWDFIARNPLPKLVERAIQSQETAARLEAKLKDVEEALHADLYVFRTTLSLSVVFKRPAQMVVDKYSLSTETRSEEDDAKVGAKNLKYFAHAYAMNHVSFELVDKFSHEILRHGYPQELDALRKSHPDEYDEIMKLP